MEAKATQAVNNRGDRECETLGDMGVGMNFCSAKNGCFFSALILFLISALCSSVAAQTGTGTLRGQVTDPSGAVVPQVRVVVTTPAGQQVVAITTREGNYEVSGIQAGTCKVQVNAGGFAPFEKDDLQITAGQVATLPISLEIQQQQEKVEVSSDAPTVDVTPTNNAGAVVLEGKDLEALSDDPDELESDLTALAGPTAGPNGGQMYIDGFTAGQLPPKSSIREIRINQNPFSSEYDKLGYGRVEIFTKPGTDNWHGQIEVQGNDSAFNSRNPFAKSEPPYDSTLFNGNIGGPLSKKASFFLSAQRRDISNVDVVSATVVDPTTNDIVPFSDSVPNPRTRTNISPRLDYQLTKTNTLSVRYQYYRDNEQNLGIGQFNLASQGYNELSTEQTLQVSDTQSFGSNIINETHFQYLHDASSQLAQNSTQTINVLGAFTSGGSNAGNIIDATNHYEVQNYTSIVHGKHVLKFGARLREETDNNNASSAFNGLYTFSSINAYQIMQQGLANGDSTAQIILNGGGPRQYSVTIGAPLARSSLFDSGVYVQDDWRVRTNVTVSLGLRVESQNDISDHADWAPRVALAWGLTKNTVLRVGSGFFYDRFTDNLVLQAQRLNGILQTQYVIQAPDFLPPNTPSNSSIAALPGAQRTVYEVAPNLRAPGTLQTAVTLERQLSKAVKLSVSYLNSRGFDQLLSNSINTPNPQTGVAPFGNVGNIYQYISEGIYRQNQLITNFTVRAGSRLSLNAYYVLNYADSNTSGANSFASDPYNLMLDYGRASFSVRNRVFLGGTVALPKGFSLNPFLLVASGQPFNLTLGQDLIGSSIFNQRPAFASALSLPQNVIQTPLGAFDTVPQPGETIVPVNYATGPGQLTLNLRLSKTFGFGKVAERPTGGGGGGFGGGGGRGPGGGVFGGARPGGLNTNTRRYNLTLSVNARNVFNDINLAPPIGIVTSPRFDQSNALSGGAFSSSAAPRVIYLQSTFTF